jgi:hypothetical protein
MRLLLLSALAFALVSGHPSLPSELFSPLIAQKLLVTAQLQSGVPTSYPQYTTRDTGAWRFLDADTWTSGFLPATFYALAERAALCPNTMNCTTEAQWLTLARTSVTGEIPLEVHTSVGHSVGFLSFPFVDELAVYVTTIPPSVFSHVRQLPVTFTPQKPAQRHRVARCRDVRRGPCGAL